MSSSTPCCPTDVKPAVNNYKGIGNKVKLSNGLGMYVTGSGTTAVVNVYDIFGQTPNVEQFADGLAAGLKCVVAVPDIVPDAWDYKNIPPSKNGNFPEGVEPADGVDVLVAWIMSLETNRLDDMKAVKEYLVQEYGIRKMGLVGMCWGAKVAFLAAAEPGLADAVAACHGSFLTKQDVENIQVPVCLLNSKDEPESYGTDIKPLLENKPLCLYKDFPDIHHGWMGTRGVAADTDFDDTHIAQQYAEGLSDLVNFFSKAFAEA